jgi:hypothetical protein
VQPEEPRRRRRRTDGACGRDVTIARTDRRCEWCAQLNSASGSAKQRAAYYIQYATREPRGKDMRDFADRTQGCFASERVCVCLCVCGVCACVRVGVGVRVPECMRQCGVNARAFGGGGDDGSNGTLEWEIKYSAEPFLFAAFETPGLVPVDGTVESWP